MLLDSFDIKVLKENGQKLKTRLGTDFVDKLGEDSSLIEIMYE